MSVTNPHRPNTKLKWQQRAAELEQALSDQKNLTGETIQRLETTQRDLDSLREDREKAVTNLERARGDLEDCQEKLEKSEAELQAALRVIFQFNRRQFGL